MSGRIYALKPASLEAISRRAIDREQACADLAALMQRGSAALAAWWRISRERFELLDLSEHSLRDIGLSRATVVRDRAFWKAPAV
jgi:uncharacterized protein YjiS (DUF1127 family)